MVIDLLLNTYEFGEMFWTSKTDLYEFIANELRLHLPEFQDKFLVNNADLLYLYYEHTKLLGKPLTEAYVNPSRAVFAYLLERHNVKIDANTIKDISSYTSPDYGGSSFSPEIKLSDKLGLDYCPIVHDLIMYTIQYNRLCERAISIIGRNYNDIPELHDTPAGAYVCTLAESAKPSNMRELFIGVYTIINYANFVANISDKTVREKIWAMSRALWGFDLPIRSSQQSLQSLLCINVGPSQIAQAKYPIRVFTLINSICFPYFAELHQQPSPQPPSLTNLVKEIAPPKTIINDYWKQFANFTPLKPVGVVSDNTLGTEKVTMMLEPASLPVAAAKLQLTDDERWQILKEAWKAKHANKGLVIHGISFMATHERTPPAVIATRVTSSCKNLTNKQVVDMVLEKLFDSDDDITVLKYDIKHSAKGAYRNLQPYNEDELFGSHKLIFLQRDKIKLITLTDKDTGKSVMFDVAYDISVDDLQKLIREKFSTESYDLKYKTAFDELYDMDRLPYITTGLTIYAVKKLQPQPDIKQQLAALGNAYEDCKPATLSLPGLDFKIVIDDGIPVVIIDVNNYPQLCARALYTNYLVYILGCGSSLFKFDPRYRSAEEDTNLQGQYRAIDLRRYSVCRAIAGDNEYAKIIEDDGIPDAIDPKEVFKGFVYGGWKFICEGYKDRSLIYRVESEPTVTTQLSPAAKAVLTLKGVLHL